MWHVEYIFTTLCFARNLTHHWNLALFGKPDWTETPPHWGPIMCHGVSNHRQLECSCRSLFRHAAILLIIGPLWGESGSDSPHKGPVMQKAFPCHDIIEKTVIGVRENLIELQIRNAMQTCHSMPETDRYPPDALSIGAIAVHFWHIMVTVYIAVYDFRGLSTLSWDLHSRLWGILSINEPTSLWGYGLFFGWWYLI